MKIKLCGIMRLSDIDAVNASKPDYIGFIFAKSRRRISFKLAGILKQRLDPSISAVGVFVDAPIKRICIACEEGLIDAIQLHGHEDEAYINELKQHISLPVIKAVRVQNTQQIIQAQALPCDYLLLDTFDKNAAGGTGKTFDWALVPKLIKPYFLAGGLNPNNIEQAATLDAYCLDISSGVETDGVKDPQKIKQAVEMIRRIQP